jgi:hypothetical protein
MDWFPEESNWSGFRDVSIGLSEEHRGTVLDIDSERPLTQPPLSVADVSLEAADEQCWLERRGSDGRVVCVESQPDVVGWRRNVVDIQTEEGGENYSFLIHASPHTTKSGCV